jgi:hypothetical protein
MNEGETYNERLLIFADYIDGIVDHPEFLLSDEVELVALEKKTRYHYKPTFRPWVFDFLPSVFDKWFYGENSNPIFTDCDEEAGTVAAVIDFFGLSHEEFLHCFCFDYGEELSFEEKFGGEKLTEESQCSDIARNIVELVKRRK